MSYTLLIVALLTATPYELHVPQIQMISTCLDLMESNVNLLELQGAEVYSASCNFEPQQGDQRHEQVEKAIQLPLAWKF